MRKRHGPHKAQEAKVKTVPANVEWEETRALLVQPDLR